MDLSCLLVRLRECIHSLAGIVTTRPSITRRRCRMEAQRPGALPGIFGGVRAVADGLEERWQVWTIGSALKKKISVLEKVLEKHKQATEPLEALAAFGGLEIATLAGAVIQAASERRVIVVDGFIASSAVLVASQIRPAVLDYCIFSHRSDEQGHSLMLNEMSAEPLLDLNLRLGEGSGAALAWPLLMSACAIIREMASFETAGVSRDDDTQ